MIVLLYRAVETLSRHVTPRNSLAKQGVTAYRHVKTSKSIPLWSAAANGCHNRAMAEASRGG
jgi:hypothetical protein